MSINPPNSPNYSSARVLLFPDGTLTPEAKKFMQYKPENRDNEFAEQQKRISELLIQVKALEEEHKKAKAVIARLDPPCTPPLLAELLGPEKD